VYQHTFANGLTLLAERMPYVRSAAFCFLAPAGSAFDPPTGRGTATVLAEMLARGAGDRDSRALALALDNLGVDHDESVATLDMRLTGATVSWNLAAALEIYADVVRRPHLPDDELDAVRSLALQDIQSLEDEPQQRVTVELRRRYYPAPLDQDRLGTVEGLQALTPQAVREHYAARFRPAGMILAVAGNVEWGPLLNLADRLFGDWSGEAAPLPKVAPATPPFVEHIAKETEQTQIAVAYPSVPLSHPDYYLARGAVNVLSGGMSARLFTEVREKRGLCYAVSASHAVLKDRGSVFAYAGTRAERAQETLDCLLGELRRLRDGITDDEVERVQAGLKSSLIMQQESSGSRASSLASDWSLLGRVRSIEEIQSAVDALTPRTIIGHLERFTPAEFRVLTLGPKPLNIQ
jgi:predicted Zn-dependent peptidase